MTQGETSAARNIVIVVDDDPGMLTGIRRLLRAHGFEVRVFTAAKDCLTGSDSSEAICIVLDINLKEQSGIDFCVQLRRDGINHPVIFITGIDSEIVREAAMAAGCVAYLAKPFQAELLIGAIESAFAQEKAAMRTPRERA
jgi:FixJ family two-component response regulator